ELLANRRDGRVKLLATTRALAVRSRRRDLFEDGDYVPLAATGARRDSLFAFARQLDDDASIVCVPRLVAPLVSDSFTPPLGSAVWADTRIELPVDSGSYAGAFKDAFTGAVRTPRAADGRLTLAVSDLFDRFPIALLEPWST